jgi:hypothetical protein
MKWINEWPTIGGFYWFYGKRYKGALKDEPFFVRVHRKEDGKCIYVCEGNFLYKEEGAVGLWRKIENPELP